MSRADPDGLYLRGYYAGLDGVRTSNGGRRHGCRDYSAAELARAADLRSKGWRWRAIGVELGRDFSGLRAAVVAREGRRRTAAPAPLEYVR